eukprot:ctg_3183.g415
MSAWGSLGRAALALQRYAAGAAAVARAATLPWSRVTRVSGGGAARSHPAAHLSEVPHPRDGTRPSGHRSTTSSYGGWWRSTGHSGSWYRRCCRTLQGVRGAVSACGGPTHPSRAMDARGRRGHRAAVRRAGSTLVGDRPATAATARIAGRHRRALVSHRQAGAGALSPATQSGPRQTAVDVRRGAAAESASGGARHRTMDRGGAGASRAHRRDCHLRRGPATPDARGRVGQAVGRDRAAYAEPQRFTVSATMVQGVGSDGAPRAVEPRRRPGAAAGGGGARGARRLRQGVAAAGADAAAGASPVGRHRPQRVGVERALATRLSHPFRCLDVSGSTEPLGDAGGAVYSLSSRQPPLLYPIVG